MVVTLACDELPEDPVNEEDAVCEVIVADRVGAIDDEESASPKANIVGHSSSSNCKGRPNISIKVY